MINNNMKGSQLMTFRMNFEIQLRMIWKLSLKLMFMNPFDEYVKQVEMKPLDDTSAEVENEMSVDVIG
jgi:hypothetical protein